jgi:hypothetical protein
MTIIIIIIIQLYRKLVLSNVSAMFVQSFGQHIAPLFTAPLVEGVTIWAPL